ncbi:MAG: protoporphyrinogen oxidase [Bacteroidales bacterium]|nr:protoporphyrinogen oxidase [Bacteroidales bacterium]
MIEERSKKVVIIGGGLTGLTLAYLLQRKGVDFILLEKDEKAGGVIRTHHHDGFTYEIGPNTGIIAHPEVAELFEMLSPDCELELADPKAENRWILKNGKWHALPSGFLAAVKTPLFSWKDKFGILSEPFRKKGDDPMESIAGLVKRRLGQSYLDYAVDPFISGIYAGDPDSLITKYALPKLYALEQNYGSFIKGAVKKAREPRSQRDRKATRKVFSAKGGLGKLIAALVKNIPEERLVFSAKDIKIAKNGNEFTVGFKSSNDDLVKVQAEKVVTTTGAYTLTDLFDFIDPNQLLPVTKLNYAKVVQVIMAFRKWNGPVLNAFGGLVPTKENRKILGVLFPSSIFQNRVPEDGALLSVFLGGVKKPEIYDMDDTTLLEFVNSEMTDLLHTNLSEPAFTEIHRYKHAIPQYDIASPQRLQRIHELEEQHPGLILAGNIRDGIGIADRIKQATEISKII